VASSKRCKRIAVVPIRIPSASLCFAVFRPSALRLSDLAVFPPPSLRLEERGAPCTARTASSCRRGSTELAEVNSAAAVVPADSDADAVDGVGIGATSRLRKSEFSSKKFLASNLTYAV
jgi:hypothetical protein